MTPETTYRLRELWNEADMSLTWLDNIDIERVVGRMLTILDLLITEEERRIAPQEEAGDSTS